MGGANMQRHHAQGQGLLASAPMLTCCTGCCRISAQHAQLTDVFQLRYVLNIAVGASMRIKYRTSLLHALLMRVCAITHTP